MVSLSMLTYHMTQSGYSSSFPALQYWCSDTRWWDSHFRRPISWRVWNWFHVLSDRWHFWRSQLLQAVLPPGLVEWLTSVLDAHGVVLTGSQTGGWAPNSISGVDTTLVLHRHCRECCWVPKSPTLQGYSPITWTVATLLQPAQWPICKALPLQPRWKSVQDKFHPPPVLLACQHPNPSSHDETDGPNLVLQKLGSGQTWNWIFAAWKMVIWWHANRMRIQQLDCLIMTLVFKLAVDCIGNQIKYWACILWVEDLLTILHLLLNLRYTFVGVIPCSQSALSVAWISVGYISSFSGVPEIPLNVRYLTVKEQFESIHVDGI